MRIYRWNGPARVPHVGTNGRGGASAAGRELDLYNAPAIAAADRLRSCCCYIINTPWGDNLPLSPELVCALTEEHLYKALERAERDSDESREFLLPSGVLHLYDVPREQVVFSNQPEARQVLVPARAVSGPPKPRQNAPVAAQIAPGTAQGCRNDSEVVSTLPRVSAANLGVFEVTA